MQMWDLCDLPTMHGTGITHGQNLQLPPLEKQQ
jgi:hypothetical protein